MANIGAKLFIFTVSVHILLTFGVQNGIIGEDQAGQSQEYVSKFQNGEVVQNANIEADSGIVDQVSLAIKSVPIIGDIYSLITTPYGIMTNSNLPWLLRTFVTSIIGVLDLALLFKLIRGVDF